MSAGEVSDVATGCIRERNGRFYVRTRVYVVDPEDGRVALEAGREGRRHQ